MNAAYCQIKSGSDWLATLNRFSLVLHVHDLPIRGIRMHQARSVEDFQALAVSVDKVLFYFADCPRKAVAKDKAARWFRKLAKRFNEVKR